MIGTKLYKPRPNHDTEYINAVKWCSLNNATIEDKGGYYEVVAIPLHIITKEDLQQATIDHMNAEVAVKDYSSIESACSYATSSDQVYSQEGKEANDFRDSCWKYFYEQTKNEELPTIEEYQAGLPVLGWN